MNIDDIATYNPVMPKPKQNCYTINEIWDRWQQSAEKGSGEQRDMAVNRMRICIDNSAAPLDLRTITLFSLPPYLPASAELLVSENLLPPLIDTVDKNHYADDITAAFIDNFLFYHFDKALDDVSACADDVSSLSQAAANQRSDILSNIKTQLIAALRNGLVSGQEEKLPLLTQVLHLRLKEAITALLTHY